MFRLFVSWLESGDRINPIALRDLRRLRRWHVVDILGGLFLLGMFALFFCYRMAGCPPDGEGFLAAVPFWISGLFVLLIDAWLMSGLAVVGSSEGLFERTPLSPVRQLNGYLLGSILPILFFIVLFVPVHAASVYFSPTGFVPLLLCFVPPFILLAGVLLVLYTLSLVPGAQSKREIAAVDGAMFFVVVPAVILPWAGMFYLGAAVLQYPGTFFAWTTPIAFVPLMLLTFGILAYRLSLYRFEHREMTVWQGAFRSALCYLIWSVAWAGLFFLRWTAWTLIG